MVAATTAGPCTTENDLLREDVSEGWTGLPVRLALRVVDRSCNPLAGATVRIWHTNIEGSYSGETPSNRFCLLNQAHASRNFFRGVQVTDADGTVFFDTCFPGWYPGRAVHIHFQVEDDSRSYRISQLFFPEDVTQDIFATHSEYVPYGQPDTVFATDGIIAAIPIAERERHLLSVARMTDGAMLASKTVTVVDQAPATTPSTTPTESTTAVPTASATVSPTPPAVDCVGDCDDDGSVSIAELIRGVDASLGSAGVSACPAFDADGSNSVGIDELINAVNAALNGCTG
jgi:protocatechuate 3,4-dioxygenase beta subunit